MSVCTRNDSREKAEVPVRVSTGGAEGAAWVEEEEEGRKTFKQPPNCHQLGSCPREGDALAGGGAGEEKSKGRREDFPADYTQTTAPAAR